MTQAINIDIIEFSLLYYPGEAHKCRWIISIFHKLTLLITVYNSVELRVGTLKIATPLPIFKNVFTSAPVDKRQHEHFKGDMRENEGHESTSS